MKLALVLAVAALAAASPLAAQPATAPAPVTGTAAPAAAPPPAPTPAPATATGNDPATPAAADDPDADGAAAAAADEPTAEPESVAPLTPPQQWTEWAITGHLIDDRETLQAVLEPEMNTHRALTEAAQSDLAEACQKYGYELVEFTTERLAGGGVRAILHLEPVPMVSRVDVELPRWSLLSVTVDDELRRRMRLREGSYLPWAAGARQAELDEEAQRLGEYLRDEGLFDATVQIGVRLEASHRAVVTVRIRLGSAYHLGRIRIQNERDLAIDGTTLRDAFRRRNLCESVLGKKCWSFLRTRFTRADHQAAIQNITRMFRNRGYPAVKVTTDFDPATSFDRRRHAVDLTLIIDQRRYIDVVFEGNDKDDYRDETLRQRLTFTEAASADEYEVQASAAAIQAYYQSRGHFEAIVTWGRESFRAFDRIVYRIDEGPRRSADLPSFEVVAQAGDQPALSSDEMASAIGASKYLDSWFRSAQRPSSSTMADDSERLRRAFRERGYPDAEVGVEVSPDPGALDSAAVTGALLAADRRRGELHLRYTIRQGARTVLDQIRITFEEVHRQSCATLLAQIGSSIGVPDLASKAIPSDPCTAAGVGIPALPERLEAAAVRLKDWYWGQGRPRAEITLAIQPGPARPNMAVADIRVRERDEVRIGKVLVRGNFRTETWVIRDELRFPEGKPLTRERYESGPRNLRTTGLFNSVNVELIDFEDTTDGKVNVVVNVQERHNGKGWLVLETGYSTYKSFFVSGQLIGPNLCLAFWRSGSCGTGTRASLSGTYGFTLRSVEASLRFPRWLMYRAMYLPFDTELSGLYRLQETDRFGELETIGASLAISRTWQRLRTESRPARSLSVLLRYDYRYRYRDDDAIRAAGPDIEDSRVPVRTTTGSVGPEIIYDQRTDRTGNLSPLAPEKGFQLQLGVSFAHPALSFGNGEAVFTKVYGAGQLYWRLTERLLLRFDGRFDQGFVHNAQLLPEVERFFAGGDTTVRGYEEDRLATEIIEAGVPPFDGATQLRILPAGGNIRAVGSIDAQIRLAQLPGTSLPLASGLFVDAGMIRNTWKSFDTDSIRPALGVSLVRIVTPVGSFALDYAVPIFPQTGDDPLGRLHISVALRN